MRTDLTTAFQSAMAADGRAPVQLLAFHFAAGDVLLSDRDLGPADGLADSYAGLVEDWGALEDVSATDPGELSAEIRQMALTIWNGGNPPFSDYFLKEDPENISVDLYQWFSGLGEDDKTRIDSFLIADPISFDERARLVKLDLVSLAINFDQPAGHLLSAADWPTARPADIGRAVNFCFGNCGPVDTLCAKLAPAATLAGSILATTATITTHEDLDALGFSSAGTLQIGEELVRYSGRTATAFTGCQRGYLSEAAEHLDRDAVVEKINDHTYILGRGPLGAVEKVQVGGFDAPAGIYTIAAGQDPARVIFSEKPYAFRFAAGSTFLEMQFDTLGDGNTAVQPHLAYDAGSDATAARIDEDHRRLALRQTTINADRGAIVKAYLAIEHWESAAFLNDYAEVWVEGIGVVGRLSRPNAADTIEIEAEVDLDHGHSHQIGGEHSHTFHDPAIVTNETPHTHTSSVGGVSTHHTGDAPAGGFSLRVPYTVGAEGEQRLITFAGAPKKWDGAILKFRFEDNGAQLWVYAIGVSSPWGTYGGQVGAGYVSFRIPARNADTAPSILFLALGNGMAGFADATITDISLEVQVDVAIDDTYTGVQTQIATSGSNDAIASDKQPDDVENLATDNQAIEVTSTAAATRTHVNLFDITTQVNFDWGWFSGRDIRVTYQGSNDNRAVYILHCFFDVEFRRRERFYSDEVTATVAAGLVDDGAGTITGSAGAAITRADHVARYLLTACGGFDAARIHTSSWAAAAARLNTKGYGVDGILAGDLTIKDALKAVLYQNRLRLFYAAGLAKLAFLEAFEDWPEGRAIAPADYQLKSLAIERQPARAIVNTVNLFYARDWTAGDDGPAAYEKTATATHAASIAKHGARADDERFLFDLVRADAQAADLAGYYAERLAWPSNYFRFNAYLPQFDLEKEDKLNLTASFHRLRKAKARVIGAARIFGSGKLEQINHIQFLAECLRYILIEHAAADSVAALDALAVSVGLDADFEDLATVGAEMFAALGVGAADEVNLADALSIMALFAPTHTEAITAADALGVGIGVNVEELVHALDDAIAWRTFGFGGGEFGSIGFGGWVIWRNRAPDEVQAAIELFIELTPGAFPLAATVDDDLFFSCGFGCPLGSGFGLGPFGD
jgi:hypothetical protein